MAVNATWGEQLRSIDKHRFLTKQQNNQGVSEKLNMRLRAGQSVSDKE